MFGIPTADTSGYVNEQLSDKGHGDMIKDISTVLILDVLTPAKRRVAVMTSSRNF
jgi:hypothetical protein